MAPKIISRKEAKAQGLTRYFTGKPCKYGHVAERHVSDCRCEECYERRKREIIDGRRDNPVKRQSARDNYNRWAKTGGGRKTRARCIREWHENNPDRSNERQRKRRLSDLNFRLRMQLRVRINDAVRSDQKAGSAVRDLGCSMEVFKPYIASQFKDGMNWGNLGEVWQLDHIKPLGLFDLRIREQFLAACHYTNLQPLSIADHVEKSVMDRALIRNARR